MYLVKVVLEWVGTVIQYDWIIHLFQEKRYTHRYVRGEGHVMTEIRVMCLQVKGHQGYRQPPEAGRGRKHPPIEPSEGAQPS